MLPKPPTSPRLIPATHCLSPTRNHPHKRSHIGRKKGYEKKKKEKKEEEEKEEEAANEDAGDEEAKEEDIGKRSSVRETRKPRLSLVCQ